MTNVMTGVHRSRGRERGAFRGAENDRPDRGDNDNTFYDHFLLLSDIFYGTWGYSDKHGKEGACRGYQDVPADNLVPLELAFLQHHLESEVAPEHGKEFFPGRSRFGFTAFYLHREPGEVVAGDQKIYLLFFLVAQLTELKKPLSRVGQIVTGLQQMTGHEIFKTPPLVRNFAVIPQIEFRLLF